MNELKAFEVTRKALFGRTSTEKVYLKSEADAVIAELEESHKMEVGQLLVLNREQANAANRLRDSMEQAICHHKYKRCLDKAELCKLEQERIELIECQDITDDDFNKLVKGFYKKWRERWLKIAEKFKDGK